MNRSFITGMNYHSSTLLYLIALIGTLYTMSAIGAEPCKPVTMTVFVHGIFSVKPYLNTNNLIRFIQDDVQDTYYEKSIAFMRENEFFYKNQAMGPLGLHLIDQSATGAAYETHKSAITIANLFDHMNKLAHTGRSHNRYYQFGWSALLSPRARYQDSVKLFKALEEEVEKLRNLGMEPTVRVIGYSHGGNVALNLGAAHQKAYPNSTLVINELILLGTPIQHDTDYLINDPVFKHVYNIYSLSDRVQRIDFFSLDRFFSGRVFTPRKGFTLPDKLVQVQLKVTRPSLRHKPLEERIRKTSNLRGRGMISGKSHLLTDTSPGHIELWAFGWTPQHYRMHYPLYPLPTVCLLPFITHYLETYQHAHDKQHRGNKQPHIVFDIRPAHEYIIVRKRHSKIIDKIIPFVSRETLALLQQETLALMPENYNTQEYEARTEQAIKDSYDQYQQLYAPKGQKKFTKRCRAHQRKHYCKKQPDSQAQ